MHSRVRCRNATCRLASLVRPSCETRIFDRGRHMPAHVPPRSCRCRSSVQPSSQHLSTNAACVIGVGTSLCRECVTTKCDHEVTRLLDIQCPTTDMHMHSGWLTATTMTHRWQLLTPNWPFSVQSIQKNCCATDNAKCDFLFVSHSNKKYWENYDSRSFILDK